MKYTILTLILLFSIKAQAQDTTNQQSQVFEVIDKIGQKAYSAVETIAKSLEVPATFVFETLVRQQIVNSVVYVLVFIISFVLSVQSYKLWLIPTKITKDHPRYAHDGIYYETLVSIIFGMVGFICFAHSICNINELVMGFINPEYGAIKEILDAIK